MSKYAEIIYPEDSKNPYPQKLASHLFSRFIGPSESPRKILDIGCSRGDALKRFASCDPSLELYGVDIRDEESYEDITFKPCDLESEKLPFESNYFDFIYTKSVLEHVFNTENFISESLRVLKPGGTFIGLTPDWKSQQSIFWDDYTHIRPCTLKGLRDALSIIGFFESSCEYFYQLPFTWNNDWSKMIPATIAYVLPDFLKWKTREQRNTKDRKFIRFCKERMLLAYAVK